MYVAVLLNSVCNQETSKLFHQFLTIKMSIVSTFCQIALLAVHDNLIIHLCLLCTQLRPIYTHLSIHSYIYVIQFLRMHFLNEDWQIWTDFVLHLLFIIFCMHLICKCLFVLSRGSIILSLQLICSSESHQYSAVLQRRQWQGPSLVLSLILILRFQHARLALASITLCHSQRPDDFSVLFWKMPQVK